MKQRNTLMSRLLKGVSALIAISLFAGCESYTLYDPGGNIVAPSLQMTAFAAKNVYIAETMAVSENSHFVPDDDALTEDAEMISFIAKVERVFKGDIAEGETITDEINVIYRDFLEEGQRYALCTGFVDTHGVNVQTDGEGNIQLFKGDSERKSISVFFQWEAENNIAAAVRLNDDGTFGWLRDDVPWKPTNEDELYQQLYDGVGFLADINESLSGNVTEIRCTEIQTGDVVNLDDTAVYTLKQKLQETAELQPYNSAIGIVGGATSITEPDDIAFWKKSIAEYKGWVHEPYYYDKAKTKIGFEIPTYEINDRNWYLVLVCTEGEPTAFFAYNTYYDCMYDIENQYWIVIDGASGNEQIFTGTEIDEDGNVRQASSSEASSEEVKTVTFPEDTTYETLTDEELKNRVFTLLDSVDPLPKDPYWSGYPRATVDDPETYGKIKALGTAAVPYILLYINENRGLNWNDSYYLYSAAETMVRGDHHTYEEAFGDCEEIEYTDELKETYSEASWKAYVLMCHLAGRTLREAAD